MSFLVLRSAYRAIALAVSARTKAALAAAKARGTILGRLPISGTLNSARGGVLRSGRQRLKIAPTICGR